MFVNVEKLKRERQKLIEQARTLLNKAEVESRNLTAYEKSEYDDLMEDIKKYDDTIDNEERKQQEEMASSSTAIIKPEGTGAEYRSLFNVPRSTGGFETFNDFLTAVARNDTRLLEKREEPAGADPFQTGSDPLGGYVTPTQWSEWLLDSALEAEIVRPRARVYPMTMKSLKIPAWSGLDRSDGDVYGGFSGEWLDELEEATPVDGAVRNIELTGHKLAMYTSASREVLADGINFETQLKTAMRDSISFFLDKAFLTGAGSGSNQPLGLTNCTSAVSVQRGTQNEVNYIDLVNMYHHLYKGLPGQPVWICSHEVVPQLLNMTVNDKLVWQPDARSGVPGQLFGYPLIVTEKTNLDLGDTGDLMLVNLRAYAVGIRADVVIESSNAPGWLKDKVSFRIILRADGTELWNEKAETEGNHELSWLVKLGPHE